MQEFTLFGDFLMGGVMEDSRKDQLKYTVKSLEKVVEALKTLGKTDGRLKSILSELTFTDKLEVFLIESNSIDDILLEITSEDLDVAQAFIRQKHLMSDNIQAIVEHFQPGAVLRNKVGIDACEGNFIPQKGGLPLETAYFKLINTFNSVDLSDTKKVFDLYCEYQILSPFTDCNGRSGRLIWLWCFYWNLGFLPNLSFLHLFYYYGLKIRRLNDTN